MADVIIGASLQADDQISPKVKNIKQALREAQEEVVNLSAKFGATSKEAAAAAKKAADLKDAIGDARTLVDAFNPDTKFRAFGAAINTVTGGFTALTGALALLDIQSEDVQKTLLKVQSAMAISQGVASVQEGIQSFKNLKSVLIDTLGKNGAIGLAIAGVAALGYAIYEVFTSSEKLTDQQKALNELNTDASKIYANEKQKLDQLIRPLQNENTTKREKLEAIKKLQQTYPNYFQNLDLENGKVVGLAEGYAKVVKAIELKARATAAANMLAKQEEQLLELGFKYGITTEADADKFLANLEKTGQTFLIQIANGVKAKREFLKGIQAEAERGLSAAGGDPTGGGVKGIDKETKAKELQAEYDFGRTKSEIDQNNRMQLANNALAMRRILLDGQAAMDTEELTAAQEQYYALRQADEDYNAAIQASQQLAFENKMKMMQAVGSGLSSLSDLVGRETATGKVLAAAGATIDTYAAIAATLKNAAKTPAGGIPGFAIAQAIATGIFGFVQVKKILSTQVPGRGGGGGSAPSVSAPLQAQLPTASTTSLDQRSLNQIGNATSRAFVVESDITNNQERIRRLNRAARLG